MSKLPASCVMFARLCPRPFLNRSPDFAAAAPAPMITGIDRWALLPKSPTARLISDTSYLPYAAWEHGKPQHSRDASAHFRRSGHQRWFSTRWKQPARPVTMTALQSWSGKLTRPIGKKQNAHCSWRMPERAARALQRALLRKKTPFMIFDFPCDFGEEGREAPTLLMSVRR